MDLPANAASERPDARPQGGPLGPGPGRTAALRAGVAPKPLPGAPVRCPVCKARFRGQRQCSRCGADLSRLMLVVARAYELRRQARQALLEAHYGAACELAEKAQTLHHTALGRKMLLMARTLDMISVRR